MNRAGFTVLHMTHCYLRRRENWLFHLIRNLPDCRNYVGCGAVIRDEPAFFDGSIRVLPNRPKGMLLRLRAQRWQWGLACLRMADRMYQRRLVAIAEQSDIVHSHFADCGWANHQWVRRVGKRHVISYYGYDYVIRPTYLIGSYDGHAEGDAVGNWGGDPAKIRQGPFEDMFVAADLFLSEGNFGRNRLIQRGCPPEKVSVQHLGVDVAHIPCLRRTKRSGQLRLVQIAGFAEKKGHRYSVEAFAAALVQCPNMTLTFVGPDPLGLRQSVIAGIPSEVLSRVSIENSIAPGALHEYLTRFDVFIHPSCHAADGDCEGGAPVVLLDAQATGMPVISSRHCDIPEEVIDGETGLLGDEKDVPALAAHIRRFYDMGQEEYARFSEAGRRHVESEYDIRKSAALLAGMYRRMAG